MAQIDNHAPGSFCWIELGTSDQNEAKSFYGSLFGWEAQDVPMGPSDFYTMFTLDGRNAAAAYTLRQEQRTLGVPPHWMLYIATDSADRSASKTNQAGGKVLAGPFDVLDVGRMAVIQDPTGGVISIWQAKSHAGIGISGENGTFCWADLITPDVERAKEFYSDAFGWQITPGEKDPTGYLHIKNGEHFIGGMPPDAHRETGAPPHWLAYFLASDCDASTAKAAQLGGSVLMPPDTMEGVGRWSVVADPQGATFALFEAAQRA